MTTPNNGHGLLGTRERKFVRMLPENPKPFSDASLEALAALMIVEDDELNDGADAEENLAVPAGYTYFGQFVDHDLTLDTTSSFSDPAAAASNLRTPALDLDCIYGAGPQDQPYMYDADGATLLIAPGGKDLMRQAANGRAIIGDKRNDENSIVCQVQLAMIKFHNAVVTRIKAGSNTANLFERARAEVTWTYQRVVLEDYLHRIIDTHTYDFFTQRHAALGDGAYDLYVNNKQMRDNLPTEFVGAAYRFGHSMVRRGYRLNTETKKLIFDATDSPDESLIGFQPLLAAHVIDDWGRFFTPGFGIPVRNGPTPVKNDPAVRLQWAYKIDPSLVDPLAKLPPSVGAGASLAVLNLKRGNLPTYAIATGQDFAAKLHEKPLGAGDLMVRVKTPNGFSFRSIASADPRFLTETPLWFYILAEAQQPTLAYWREVGQRDLNDDDFATGPCSVSQLGPVGGRILMEVFNGIVDSDQRSFRRAAPSGWTPMIGNVLGDPEVHRSGLTQSTSTSAGAGLRAGPAGRRAGVPSAIQPTSVSPGSQKAAEMAGSRTLTPLSILPPKPSAWAAVRKLLIAPPTAAHCSWAGTCGWPRSMRATTATVTGGFSARSASSAAPSSPLPALRAASANSTAMPCLAVPRTSLNR